MIAAEHAATPSSGNLGSTPTTVLGSTPAVAAEGLTSTQAARRLSEFGPNRVVTGGRFRVLRTGLGLLTNPLVLILLAASVVSGIVGETLDAGIIVTIVLVSVGLDFFQIFQSEQAASKLQSLSPSPPASGAMRSFPTSPCAMSCPAMSSSYARAIWSQPTRR